MDCDSKYANEVWECNRSQQQQQWAMAMAMQKDVVEHW
jgi:hypothetical protein